MSLEERIHHTDIAVVGGGLAGMLAAIAAARHGSKAVLMNDRPVLGGNCSSEIRMWALGCHGENNRETGIFEEILLENMRRNPTRNFSIWDSILYEKVRGEENITLLLNCSCNDLEQGEQGEILSVRGWQTTTYLWHRVYAKLFLDCSGDSVLAPLSGAVYRVGREASSEFGESIAPEKADRKTMGMSCMIQVRETDHYIPFTPPDWAHVYPDESSFPHRDHDLTNCRTNFWWLELGGEGDSIRDTEELRDELLKMAFGVWDHMKNYGDHGADNWELDWVGFLPGKRESRRYEGDHILTQNDVRAEGRFPDVIAYGGWSMDDHHPAGFAYPGEPTIYHAAPAPYGIPYRCLYSCNVENLMFAGRNISTTHAALSSSRVMATCAVLGQAAGTAASIAVREGISPRGVYKQRLGELQQTLMDDDCWLPGFSRTVSSLSRKAALTGPEGVEALRSGDDRPIGSEDNGCTVPLGTPVEYDFGGPVKLSRVRFTFDSDLERESCDGHPILRNYPMLCNKYLDMELFGFPKTMVKTFRLDCREEDGNWKTAAEVSGNWQRLRKIPLDVTASAIRFVPLETHGSEAAHLFAFEVE